LDVFLFGSGRFGREASFENEHLRQRKLPFTPQAENQKCEVSRRRPAAGVSRAFSPPSVARKTENECILQFSTYFIAPLAQM